MPKRDNSYTKRMAACIFVMNKIGFKDMVNIGSGDEVSIRELAELISEVVGFEGTIVYDSSKPDGTPRKLLDTNRQNNLGWTAQIKLKDGLRQTYRWFLENYCKEAVAV